MNYKVVFLVTLALTLFSIGNAISQRTCASEEVLERQLLQNPLLKQKMDEIERQTEEFIRSGTAQERAVITIPVVFNIVWSNPAQNISDAQIMTQLKVLNEDFRRMNADAINTPSVWQSIGADCEINFCLAAQDPKGQATSGIRRRESTAGSFSDDDQVKFTASGGLDIWDRDKYLNIWVCNLYDGLLGYAQFPGGDASTDGVVIDFEAFGTIGTASAPFALGRTATHEVGHWFNLRHIWGDAGGCFFGDNVSDTPNQGDQNYGCPNFPETSCFNGPNGDMFMNYMDYTDDACMNIYTKGQKERMQACFSSGSARASLLSSPGCQTVASCDAPGGLLASNITQTSAKLSWTAVAGAGSYNLQWKDIGAANWNTVNGITGTSHLLNGLLAGHTYQWRLQSICPGLPSSQYSAIKQFTTLPTDPPTTCGDIYEPNNSQSAAVTISTNTANKAKIDFAEDVDWYDFSNSNAKPNIMAELWDLPANYDMRLYHGNQLIATSNNPGTMSEQIIYNNAPVSNGYFILIYGNNNAFNNSLCYSFRAQISNLPWYDQLIANGSSSASDSRIDIPIVVHNDDFDIFPNPANDLVRIAVPMQEEAEVVVSIVDLSGKVLLRQIERLNQADNAIDFDLSKLPSNLYFVQLLHQGQIKTRKLLIHKK